MLQCVRIVLVMFYIEWGVALDAVGVVGVCGGCGIG